MVNLSEKSLPKPTLCEKKFSKTGSLNDLEYSFFWSGKPEGERREAGLGFAIKKDDRNATASK